MQLKYVSLKPTHSLDIDGTFSPAHSLKGRFSIYIQKHITQCNQKHCKFIYNSCQKIFFLRMRISIFQFSKEITKTYSIDLLIIDLGHNRNRITRTNRSQLAIYRNYMCWIYKIRAKMQNRYLDTISFTETHDELHGQTLARFRHRPLSPYLPPWFYYLKHIK